MVGLVGHLVDGEFITGFARRSVSWKIPSTNTTIEILYGDIFKSEEVLAIGVNDRFDHVVDDKVIARSSLHGKAISNFWLNPDDWKAAIIQKLPKRSGRSVTRQPIGTCVDLTQDGRLFLFFVVSNTDGDTNVTSSSAEKLIIAVKGMLSKARVVCAGRPLSMPLVGSGLARVGLHADGVLHIILAALTEECKNSHVTSKIRIMLHSGSEGEVNLLQIMRSWS